MSKPNLLSRAVRKLDRRPQHPTIRHPFDCYRDPDFEPGAPDGVTVRHLTVEQSDRLAGRLPEASIEGAKIEAQVRAQIAAARRAEVAP